MRLKNLLLLFSFIYLLSCDTEKESENMVYIENGKTRVGVLLSTGGRLVYLSHDGSPNLLKSDSSLWNEDIVEKPAISADPVWKAYNGHIVWLGPQSEWWIHQNGNPDKRNNRSVWPPDPYLIYSEYRVLERDSSYIRIEGPESKVSGVKLIKTIQVNDDGSVLFETEAINIREEHVSWDLWLNTRVEGFSHPYIRVNQRTDIRVDSPHNDKRDSLLWEFKDSFFTLQPALPTEGKNMRNGKAYIYPAFPMIHSFSQGYCLTLRMRMVDREMIHPDQAMIEIYNSISAEDELTELEYHDAYRELKPGEKMRTWQKWIIQPFNEENTYQNQVEFLNRNYYPGE